MQQEWWTLLVSWWSPKTCALPSGFVGFPRDRGYPCVLWTRPSRAAGRTTCEPERTVMVCRRHENRPYTTCSCRTKTCRFPSACPCRLWAPRLWSRLPSRRTSTEKTGRPRNQRPSLRRRTKGLDEKHAAGSWKSTRVSLRRQRLTTVSAWYSITTVYHDDCPASAAITAFADSTCQTRWTTATAVTASDTNAVCPSIPDLSLSRLWCEFQNRGRLWSRP